MPGEPRIACFENQCSVGPHTRLEETEPIRSGRGGKEDRLGLPRQLVGPSCRPLVPELFRDS